MVEKYSYGAYGNPYEGRFINMQKNNPYGYNGQRFEPELRMYSFAYRTYNPMSMRWMTPDPIRDGMNWYQYLSGDPVNLWDPLGLHWAGGMNIQYPDDFDPEDISLESSLEKAKEHMDIVTKDDLYNAIDSVKEQIQFGLRAELVKDYGTAQGIGKIYNEINKNIPPDVSFGQPYDLIKSATDAVISIVPENENVPSVEEYAYFIMNENKKSEG